MVFGHQKQLRSLKNMEESDGLAHAYIFSGPDKIGKKTVALEWLSRVLGAKLKPDAAHPDFLFLSPTIDEKTQKIAKEIAVGQIREMIGKLSLKASAGGYKGAIIDDAHLMNSEAQNCLLKTLEEPPGKAIVILVAQDEGRLLETVRSRAQIVKFGFIPAAEMEKFGAEYTAAHGLKTGREQIKDVADLSFGRPGRMVDFLEDADLAEIWQNAAKEFARIAGADLPEKFAYTKKITDEQKTAKAKEINLHGIIEIWQYYFRNRLLESLNPPETGILSDLQRPGLCEDQFVFSKLKERQSGRESEKIADILKKIQELDLVLRTTNAHPRLAIENFFLDLRIEDVSCEVNFQRAR